MLVIRDLSTAAQIEDFAIRDLVIQRINDLGGADFDADAIGHIVLMQQGDTVESIGAQESVNIFYNRYTGMSYGDKGYTPHFEFIEEFDSCYDLVFVLDDSGYGVEIFVPKNIDIPPRLLAMCRQYAFRSPPEESE
jgi:hypothetical protein